MNDWRIWIKFWIFWGATICGLSAQRPTVEQPQTSLGIHPSQATIYLSAESNEWEQRAAALLQESWERWTGYSPQIIHGREPRAGRRGGLRGEPFFYGWEFSIGETSFNRRWVPLPDSEDQEAFRYRSRRFLFGIRGNTPQAVYLGVSRFIQEELGIYWLFPGEKGWEFTQHLPAQGIQRHCEDGPGYLSRTMFGMRGSATREWLQRNGIFARFAFHHNLYKVFDEQTYAVYPEFFPLVDGHRVKPMDARGGANAQITFSNPQAAEHAAEVAIRYFDANPDRISFSLGINDTRIFSEEDRPWMEERPAFRGVPDYSNLIFLFMNRAAEKLAEKYPDRYLGCLAYYVAENVPDFPVHRQVIPYLTADRNMYWDPEFREQDEELQRRWNESGVQYWGTYDYFYGAPYDHIRDYRQLLPVTTVAAYQRGARGATAELNPRWGINLPLPWVLAQAWWNPEQSVEELYERFYQMAFGPAAATMQRFFEKGEEVWARQSGRAYWIRNYYHPMQWLWWTNDDFAELQGLLNLAKSTVSNDTLWSARLQLVERDFSQLQAGWRYWKKLEELIAHARVPTEYELHSIMEDLLWCNGRPGNLSTDLFPEIPMQPLALLDSRMQRRPEYELIAALLAGNSRQSPISEQQKQLLRKWDSLLPDPVWTVYLASLDLQETDPGSVINSDSEWQVWMRPMSQPQVRYTENLHQWQVEQAVEVRIFREWPVQTGGIYQVSTQIQGVVTEGSRVELQVYFRDAEGRRMSGQAGRARILWLKPGDYSNGKIMQYWVQAPQGAADMLVQKVVVEQGDTDWVRFGPVEVMGSDLVVNLD